MRHGGSFCWEVAGAHASGARGEEGVLVEGEPRWDCGGERE